MRNRSQSPPGIPDLPPLPPLPDLDCRNCGKTFTPHDPRQKYCRLKCGVQYHNRMATYNARKARIESRSKALANG